LAFTAGGWRGPLRAPRIALNIMAALAGASASAAKSSAAWRESFTLDR